MGDTECCRQECLFFFFFYLNPLGTAFCPVYKDKVCGTICAESKINKRESLHYLCQLTAVLQIVDVAGNNSLQ
jgi:hypothetical protein